MNFLARLWAALFSKPFVDEAAPVTAIDPAKQRAAFLTMIAHSEGVLRVPGNDNGYNVIVGNSLFHSYADHPRVQVWIASIKQYSTAAGRYQELEHNYDIYKVKLGLPDFSPESQDRIAIQQITEAGALDPIDKGLLAVAVTRCAHLWASFPNAGYGQRQNQFEQLQTWFEAAGGTVLGP